MKLDMLASQDDIFFKNAPLVEVAMTIQFDTIDQLHAGALGLLWSKFKDEFPNFETAAPVTNYFEKFGVLSERKPVAKFSVTEEPPEPRLVFTSKNGEYLVQVQNNRFSFNWRKQQESEYPRYDKLVDIFWDNYSKFLTYLEQNSIAQPSNTQVEFIYINHISATGLDVQDVFENIVHSNCLHSELEMETFLVQLKHLIKRDSQKVGRLYTEIRKAQLVATAEDVYVLQFTSRIHPESESKKHIQTSMLKMREVINNNFKAITTSSMHDSWSK